MCYNLIEKEQNAAPAGEQLQLSIKNLDTHDILIFPNSNISAQNF